MFAVMLILVLLLFLSSYVYFMRTNPDALRSEQFSLSKLAIEKGLIGDTLSGLHPASASLVAHDLNVIPANPAPKLPESAEN